MSCCIVVAASTRLASIAASTAAAASASYLYFACAFDSSFYALEREKFYINLLVNRWVRLRDSIYFVSLIYLVYVLGIREQIVS